MKRNLTCIICPRGCSLCAEIQAEQVTVNGNACPKGRDYAISECLHPMRTVTAAIRVANRYHTMVSVKTDQPVPKEHITDVLAALQGISTEAPIAIGDILLSDLYGSNLIATKAID